MLENLTVEETEGAALCDVAHLGNEAGLISRDWNIFLNRIDQSQPELAIEELNAFKERWQRLMRNGAGLASSEELTTDYERMDSYLQSMVVVMDAFIENNISTGNRLLLAANLQYAGILDDLQDEFAARRWLRLVCPIQPEQRPSHPSCPPQAGGWIHISSATLYPKISLPESYNRDTCGGYYCRPESFA